MAASVYTYMQKATDSTTLFDINVSITILLTSFNLARHTHAEALYGRNLKRKKEDSLS